MGEPELYFDNRLVPVSPGLLTISEAAQMMRVSVSSVRRLQQGRHIPFVKVGGSLRFLKTDLIDYLANQRVAPIK